MGSMSLTGTCLRQEDEPILAAALKQASREAFASAMKDGTIARVVLHRQQGLGSELKCLHPLRGPVLNFAIQAVAVRIDRYDQRAEILDAEFP